MLLIDAYNVLWLGNASEPHGPDLTVSGLLRLIAHSRYRRRSVQLACDGHPPQGEGVPATSLGARAMIVRLGPGDIIYSGHGGSADDLIERILATHSSPRSLLVVSSDNRVRRAAGRRRASTLASEAFLKQILADRVRAPLPVLPAFVEEIPLGHHAIELWRREFGLTDPEADARVLDEFSPAPPEHDIHRPTSSRDLRSLSGKSSPRPGPAGSRRPTPEKPSGSPPRLIQTQPPSTRGGPDPELEALMQEWGLRFDLDDLDMRRWLDPAGESPSA